MSLRALGSVLCVLASAATAFAGLSTNLIPGGDFEDMGKINFVGASGTVSDFKYVKQQHSPRTQAELDAGTNPVRAWQFHPDYDFGRWMCYYGAGSSNYDLMTGIGNYANPRSLWNGSDWTAAVNTHNVSVDPLNPSNHAMESVRFRTGVSMYIQAPANQAPGAAQLDFDYFFNYWDSVNLDANPQILQVFVFGVPEASLPTWAERTQAVDPDTSAEIIHGSRPGTLPYDLLYESPEWNSQLEYASTHGGASRGWLGSQGNQWQSLSDGVTDSANNYDDGSFTTTQAYPYYLVQLRMVTYAEGSEYFWLYNGKPCDTFSIGLDNISLQLNVNNTLLGDVNLDGSVNALDISGFISRLTSGVFQAEADINKDLAVNALDISGFVSCLTGGACGSGQAGGSVVPEPATFGFLAVSLLGLIRRRERSLGLTRIRAPLSR